MLVKNNEPSDILLVNPGRYLYAYPPLGFGYLSSYLKKYSSCVKNVSLVDENAKEIPERYISQYRPKIVGITATTPQINRAHEIAKFCKSLDKDIICIIGGIHVTVLPERTLREFPSFDVGIYGEAEETFRELVDNIYDNGLHLDGVDFHAINGLVYRSGDNVFTSGKREFIRDLDSMPLPDRRLYNLGYYLKPRQTIRGITRSATQMMSSRGCPYSCRFCSSALIWQRKVRFHSAERFLEEVQDLIHLGFDGFYLHDDTFIADKSRVRKICGMLIENGLHKKMVWAAQLRANLIRGEEDVEMLKLMKQAGCLQVEYGFESGSQRVLSFLKKEAATVEQNQAAIDLTKKAGLRVFGNFMMGTQGETEDEMRETQEFINRNLSKLDYYQVYVTTPYPGTELWDVCEKEGLLKDVTWEKFGMGILDDFVFSNTARSDFVHQTVQELSRRAVAKIKFKDKLQWLLVRLVDDPRYVFTMLENYFVKKKRVSQIREIDRRKEKIGILIGQILQIGGVGVAAFEEVRCLRKLGCNVELVVLKERKQFPHQDFTKDLPIRFVSREIPWPLNVTFKIPLFSFFSLFHLTFPFFVPWVVKKTDYDFLIVHETYNAFTALTLRWFRRIPFFPMIWDPASYILPRVYRGKLLGLFLMFLKPLVKVVDQLIATNAGAVLVCSRAHEDFLKSLKAKRVEVIYPGCYPLTALPGKREDFILALTKWDIGKNPNFLLEVLSRLQNRTAKLVMAGNWVQEDLRRDFLEKVNDLGLVGRVVLLGRADEKMKNDLFSRARILVHPIFEAFGMFGLEAAGCGCPLIIPEKSGVTELFQHGLQGFFPKEGDVRSFVGYIDLLLADERRAYAMGKAAWETAKRYTWEAHARRLLEVLDGKQ